MNFDDFDDGYEGDTFESYSGGHHATENNLDPFNFRDPVNSYLFLSDHAQDELENPLNRKLKCRLAIWFHVDHTKCKLRCSAN